MALTPCSLAARSNAEMAALLETQSATRMCGVAAAIRRNPSFFMVDILSLLLFEMKSLSPPLRVFFLYAACGRGSRRIPGIFGGRVPNFFAGTGSQTRNKKYTCHSNSFTCITKRFTSTYKKHIVIRISCNRSRFGLSLIREEQ